MNFVHAYRKLNALLISNNVFEQRAQFYVFTVFKKNARMYNTVVFVDGTVIGVAQSGSTSCNWFFITETRGSTRSNFKLFQF